uniref:Chaperone protein hscA n=1 Tax=Anthurium amnicola TaxID=1678845 RepID=A0A1D1YNN5_9ARAE
MESESSFKPIINKSNISEPIMTDVRNKDSALVRGSSGNYDFTTADRGLSYYMIRPKELREEHPVWHYFYLCTLIFAAFVSLFIGPVIFGMLAAIGGLATPFVLSIVGGGLGLIFGIVFGVVFSVVCIVFLVKALGRSAEWVLDTLLYGGNDLMEITKQQILTFFSPPPNSSHYHQD